jgi:predicted helicase
MSQKAINQYYNKIDQYQRFGGTYNESSIRRAFANLLEEYCSPKNLILVNEIRLKRSLKRPDGTVKDALQLDWGHWESKGPEVNLDEEMSKKFELGYPKFNIIFENSVEIVLIQQGSELMRGSMREADFLHRVLTAFVSYERPEIKDFRQAIEKFREDVPHIIEALRTMIAEQAKTNQTFQQTRGEFWQLCRESINPEISEFDIREMLIQHILTAEIFNTVFGESHFHRENNVAQQLEKVINTFFTGAIRRNTLEKIDNYYKTIKAEAARIENHHEKQKFLKVIYENFYIAYNPKGADRLGIVYTPSEVVKFMLESTDYLLEKHFGRSLANKNVEILDPATGTGTFITDLIEYIPPQYLEYKYKHEIHANELAILPYYIANLNIEHTYQQKMGRYEPFENLVFVDTLDNLGFSFAGKQEMFEGFGLSAENLARIKAQNERKISVIIGNPPYNAKQEWYNDFNPNRKYEKIDELIRESYVKHGTAQNQIVLYDMYTRFFRWASNRIDRNGIIAFVSNNVFIDSITYDGFRKVLADEFNEIYIINLKGNARTSNERRRREAGNVFDNKIRVGIAVYFLVRNEQAEGFKIFYDEVDDYLKSEDKKQYLLDNQLNRMAFERINPDKQYNWLNITDNDFDELMPLVDKDVKAGRGQEAVFKLFSRGVATQRDNWVYDFSRKSLTNKIRYLIKTYKNTLKNENFENRNTIKWDRELTKYVARKIKKKFEKDKIVEAIYRPYVKKYLYLDKHFNGMTYQWPNIFRHGEENLYIAFNTLGNLKNFHCLASNTINDLHVTGDAQCSPLYRYDDEGNRHDNITDWALEQFRARYNSSQSKIDNLKSEIEKLDIFQYIYAVLHNPAYRHKYEINLKRDFPRVPFYDDFWQWVTWGRELMELHINYETVEPYPLKLHETTPRKGNPKAKLRAIPDNGEIIVDDNSRLSGIPTIAWEYKLGNRSALECILDQYKERKPRDVTIREQFDDYQFADIKEQVINLLGRVCTVSVRTMEIVVRMDSNYGYSK